MFPILCLCYFESISTQSNWCKPNPLMQCTILFVRAKSNANEGSEGFIAGEKKVENILGW